MFHLPRINQIQKYTNNQQNALRYLWCVLLTKFSQICFVQHSGLFQYKNIVVVTHQHRILKWILLVIYTLKKRAVWCIVDPLFGPSNSRSTIRKQNPNQHLAHSFTQAQISQCLFPTFISLNNFSLEIQFFVTSVYYLIYVHYVLNHAYWCHTTKSPSCLVWCSQPISIM